MLILKMISNKDKIIRYDIFKSAFVAERSIDVWLPPGYDENPKKTFPVLYMHDGQNIFEHSLAFAGQAWKADRTIKHLSHNRKIPELIVVAVWNTFYRMREYLPGKPVEKLKPSTRFTFEDEHDGVPLGDDYLKFLVKELKPFIDKNYRTRPDAQHTLIMGSSMGGLISAYAVCEYPEIFGRAGCLSTHWLGSLLGNCYEFSDVMANYLRQNLPNPENHKFYFDFGTLNLDSFYEPHQKKIDLIMKEQGYTSGENWITEKYAGHDHNEASWRLRLSVPLMFLTHDLAK
jgi:enterochelin esterase-like enzyme